MCGIVTVGEPSEELWERGVAYERSGEKYAVFAVDLGTAHKEVLSELRPLPDSAAQQPVCALQVDFI